MLAEQNSVEAFRTRPIMNLIQGMNNIFIARWTSPAKTVFLKGSFDQWQTTFKVPRWDDNTFRLALQVSSGGRFSYIFNVDGEWKCNEDYPIEKDGQGNLNNYGYVILSETHPTAVPITWDHEPKCVEVFGSWDGWSTGTRLSNNCDGSFSAEESVSSGVYRYKFLVDGEWRINARLPTVRDEQGNLNNSVQVSVNRSKFELRYTWDMYIFGSWDGWRRPIPLGRIDGGKLSTIVQLPPGTYEFKYRDERSWFTNSNFPVTSCHGIFNNVLNVLPYVPEYDII